MARDDSKLEIEMPAPDPRFQATDEGIREAMTYLAGLLDSAISVAAAENDKRLGFALFIFEFDPGKATFYVSNAQRGDVSIAMRRWLERVEGGQ
jgi:hypothetical protein